jgi:hypothetical protein
MAKSASGVDALPTALGATDEVIDWGGESEPDATSHDLVAVWDVTL